MNQHPDLFRTLADLTGCLYISDLQFLPHSQIRTAVTLLPAGSYPAHSWVDALCYFSARYQWSDPYVHSFSAEVARVRLLQELQRNIPAF